MSPEKATRYRIGYALAPKRDDGFIQPSLLNLTKEQGIDLLPIQISKPLVDQGPFDCIIHKLYDAEWTDQLQHFHAQNPNLLVIDSPDAIERLHNRISMLEDVNEWKITDEISIGIPKQVFVETPESLLDSVESEGMSFPVIAKPLMANGSVGSHQMYLVFNKEGLEGLKLNPTPLVLQEFVNHGGVVFKVYVAGEHVRCVKRRSLMDVSEEKSSETENLLSFSQISNLSAQDQSDENIEAVELPPSSIVDEVASQLRQALKLNLFNFDMIRDSRVGDRYLVIDINYFPGYAKIPCYERMLTDFFLDLVQRKESVADCI
ncbi:hypothetical protein BUALT_Bualt19G0056800 [Buddleja alternifolia]|uniref:Inositol-tetrakisphosphate 1-kinase n=1 Tax=Buddleja alternifolia TaxID=168488 RepID=A0AAV6W7R6_9LAMI|nr:hypothetical protein BUALT_Bualt19G0056800 [Buddleja alternifolia]